MQVCLLNLQKKSDRCWYFIKSRQGAQILDCVEKISGEPLSLKGKEKIIHGLLEYKCRKCTKKVRVLESETHNCGLATRHRQTNRKRKSARVQKDLKECIEALKKFAADKKIEKIEIAGLTLLLQLSKMEKNLNLTKHIKKCIQQEEGNTASNPDRLSAIEGAALKRGVGLSKSEYEKLCFFLNYFGRKLKIFPNYKFLLTQDKLNLPGSVSYTLLNKNTEEEVHFHEAQANPRAENLMAQFVNTKFVPEMRKPNMVGCAYPIPNILANELQAMLLDLKEEMKEKEVSDLSTLEVIVKQNGDGIGDIEGLPRMRTQQILPNKIYRENLLILQIFVRKIDGQKTILYKHKAPNTMFTPTILTAVCDESDSYSMRIIGEYMKHYRNIISNSIMCIEGMKFIFHQWIGYDGKVSSPNLIIFLSRYIIKSLQYYFYLFS